MKRGYEYSYGGSKAPVRRNTVFSGGARARLRSAIIVLMLLGAVAGAVGANLTDSGSHAAIKSYLTGFFGSFDKDGISFKATLIDSFYKYSRVIIAVWASGLFSPGLVVIIVIILFKSFAYGFTSAVLVKYFGFYGFVVGFSAYIPQNIFFLPALYFVSNNALAMIFNKISDGGRHAAYRRKDGRGLADYLLILMLGLLCAAVAALTEAFLTPVLLEYVNPF